MKLLKLCCQQGLGDSVVLSNVACVNSNDTVISFSSTLSVLVN